ncbi:pyruvate formate lyase family protein [Candidatus Poribacteria bacterium]
MNRTQRLKAKLFEVDDRILFLERMEIIKECAEEYEGYNMGLKFGHTLKELLSNISIVIDEDDLIVGRVPEVLPTEEQEQWFAENRRNYFRVLWFQSTGHLTVSWKTLLNEGLQGIRERAKRHLDSISDDDGISLSKKDFLQGAILCCDALEMFALRYAQAAEDLAKSALTEERELELLRIGSICRRVPAYPARTLQEAVQAVWLVDMVMHAVVGDRDFALGRIDQYLYPFYQRDVAEGKITAEEAQELIECLYIKCSEIIGYADHNNGRKRSLCQDSVQYVILGGQTPDGRDASNPLSVICLKAGHLKLKQPTIKVRYFQGIDEGFWKEACELMRSGGSIGAYNDDVEIPAFTSVGVDLEDARDYTHYGCCNANVPGKEGSLIQRWHNMPKYLELALNNGVDPMTNKQEGPETGAVDQFESMDDLLEAIKVQIRHVMEADRANHPKLTAEDLARCSFTLESIFLKDCIENGREWRLGGTKYWHKTQYAGGMATLVDSLAAIQKMIFESGELTLAELHDVLNANFEGNEPLRQKLLNRCPKYGNDDDYVDSLAVKMADMFCDETLRCNEVPHSIKFWPSIYTYHTNKRMGQQLGATPDGRKRGENVSENQSPSYGMDLNGATACLSSMAKLPARRTPAGGNNLKLHPSAVAGDEGLETLSNLLKTYFRKGGQHVQLNIIDNSLLKEAQEHPDEFKTLSIRVTGYSAYFVTLSEKVQNDIIERTQHSI